MLLEREINRLERVLAAFRNATDAQLAAAGMTREKAGASVPLFEGELAKTRREIESIVREHPEVEPLYIMHRITG